MRPFGQCEPSLQRAVRAGIAVAILVVATLVAALCVPAAAPAASVTGVMSGGIGYKVLLVQANGKARKATITSRTGKFSITGAKLANASLHLVNPDGSYGGPVVLKASATRAYVFIKGTASLNLRSVALKTGWARASRAPTGRYQTLAVCTARAVGGRPAGAGKLGRVRTATPMGLKGAGADLDLDGVISAFDVDDNGNLVLDNVDRSGRGASRPRAGSSGAAALRLPRRAAAENRSDRRRSTRRGSSTCSPTSGRRPSVPGRRCRPRRSTRTSPRSPTSTP